MFIIHYINTQFIHTVTLCTYPLTFSTRHVLYKVSECWPHSFWIYIRHWHGLLHSGWRQGPRMRWASATWTRRSNLRYWAASPIGSCSICILEAFGGWVGPGSAWTDASVSERASWSWCVLSEAYCAFQAGVNTGKFEFDVSLRSLHTG